MNDDGELGKALLEIYPTEVELIVEYNGRHATLLDLNVSIGKGRCIYKIFDKRDAFMFISL